MDMLDLVLPELEPASQPEETPKSKTYNQYQREAKRSYKRIMKKYGAKVYIDSFTTVQLEPEVIYWNGTKQAISHETPLITTQAQLFQP